VTVNSPQITIKPPQIHHQKTTFNTTFFQKPPAKTLKTTPSHSICIFEVAILGKNPSTLVIEQLKHA
jgi:hypothetical protein